MALKVELKPNERIIVGQVVIRNGDSRTRFFIEGSAPILREKDILTAASANTPAKRIYLCVQLMYIEGFNKEQSDIYFELINEFLTAAPSARSICADINNRILSGDFYKALRTAKDLIAYEKKLVDNVSSDEYLR